LLALTVVAIIWEIWIEVRDVPIYLVPAPSDVFAGLVEDPFLFVKEGVVTLTEAMAGFVLGSTVALAGAVLMAHSRVLERSLLPLAILVKVTPIVAIAPLFVIWFGFGMMPKILITALITFFPVLVNGITGFRSVDPGAMDFLRSINASRREIFLTLRLPSSMPYLFSAFRVSIPLAVIGAVVGEWFSADRGLGSVIIVAHSNLDMVTLFGAIVTLAIMGIGLTLAVSVAEKKALFWHESSSLV
jgi:NitT/TauT family transport system permease protein